MSTTVFQQIAVALGWQTRVNENFVSVSPAGLYGINPALTTGLTFALLGGEFNGVSVANQQVTLTGSTTNYVVANKSSGVVSTATTTTNWLDTTNYLQLYQVATGASTITTATDKRQAYGGAGGSGGSFTGGTLTSALNEAPTVTIASSSTPAIGAAAANTVSITGTTTITGFDSIASGALRRVVFAGALTLTHNATSLILPTGASITTAAGDSAVFLSLGSGSWRCVDYMRASGNALSGSPFSGGTLTTALNEAPQVALASASTVNIGAAAANTVTVSGTTTITAFDTIATGAIRRVRFLGALTLTHNATSLILPGSANITTAAGDVAFMESLGSGNWRCITYFKADGTAVVGGGGGGVTGFTTSLNTSSPNNSINASQMLASGGTTNQDIVVAPKGTGAIQAQLSDSTTTGGNKRGAGAVDWQSTRADQIQVASGSRSVIGGGSSNESSGDTATVGGGDLNKSQGLGSTVGGGGSNTSSGQYSTVGGGVNCQATGFRSTTAGGSANVASGDYSCIPGGANNVASGAYSMAHGFRATTKSMHGACAMAGGLFSAIGDAQERRAILRIPTSDTTTTAVTSDGAAAGANNQFRVPTGGAHKFKAEVVAFKSSSGDTASWTVTGLAKCVAGTVSLVGTPSVTMDFNDAGASTWILAVAVDAVNGAIRFNVTGQAASDISWVLSVRTVEAGA